MLSALLFAVNASAGVTGRFSVGGYLARETLRAPDEDPSTVRNDIGTLSGRAYLRVDDENWTYVGDLRDKHDFFDKYDRERTKLTGRNELQARELFARREFGTLALAFGRLGVADAGVVFTDGVSIERRWSSLTAAAFGGLNPKRDDQTYVEWNPHASVYGLDLVYRREALFNANALVLETYDGVAERAYLYDTFSWVAETGRRVYGLGYLDFVPRTRVQTATLDWREPLGRITFLTVDAFAVDVIEYARRQALRETLAPSPYHEASLGFEISVFEARSTFGERLADHLNRAEHALRIHVPLGARWDFVSSAVYRSNFTSRDSLGRIGFGYYSDRWEWNLDAEAGVERYDDGDVRHPLALRVGCSRYFASRLFATINLDYDHDERANIIAGLFQLAYRFGSSRPAPVRDGVRGRL